VVAILLWGAATAVQVASPSGTAPNVIGYTAAAAIVGMLLGYRLREQKRFAGARPRSARPDSYRRYLTLTLDLEAYAVEARPKNDAGGRTTTVSGQITIEDAPAVPVVSRLMWKVPRSVLPGRGLE
jgi:hypothetical protein